MRKLYYLTVLAALAFWTSPSAVFASEELPKISTGKVDSSHTGGRAQGEVKSKETKASTTGAGPGGAVTAKQDAKVAPTIKPGSGGPGARGAPAATPAARPATPAARPATPAAGARGGLPAVGTPRNPTGDAAVARANAEAGAAEAEADAAEADADAEEVDMEGVDEGFDEGVGSDEEWLGVDEGVDEGEGTGDDFGGDDFGGDDGGGDGGGGE